MSLSSARSITQSVGTPRAVYLDYPLGQTAGRAGDIAEQNAILEETCKAFEELMSPGKVIDLPMRWAEDDAWKDRVMRPYVPLDGPEQAAESLSGDQRTPREATPQYQSRQDEVVADPNCERCIFLSESA